MVLQYDLGFETTATIPIYADIDTWIKIALNDVFQE